MNYIGIDNGIRGALSVFDSDNNTVESIVMPTIGVSVGKGKKNEYNIPAIVTWFKSQQNVQIVILEKAQAYPGQGAVSMFSIGRGYGIIEGILAGFGLPYLVIHPKTWQKKMFEGMPHQDTKQASILTAQRLFPNTNFLPSNKAKNIHNGMTDASLMAYYGYLLHK